MMVVMEEGLERRGGMEIGTLRRREDHKEREGRYGEKGGKVWREGMAGGGGKVVGGGRRRVHYLRLCHKKLI